MKNIIFVVLHKEDMVLHNTVLKPILVNAGQQKNKNLYEFHDANGDNITAKNPDYCETTAMYWAWKNLDKTYDYVGFFHYRRYLSFKDNTIARIFGKFTPRAVKLMNSFYGWDSTYINNFLKDYDVIMPKQYINKSQSGDFKNVFKDINTGKAEKPFKLMEKIIISKYPQMESAVHEVSVAKATYFKNIFIMKREYFNDYMEFMFNILFSLEKNCKENNVELYPRVFGFMAEYLINVYLTYKLQGNKNLKIKELPLVRKLNLSPSALINKKQYDKIKIRLNFAYLKYFWHRFF